jgi:hypothetical protein
VQTETKTTKTAGTANTTNELKGRRKKSRNPIQRLFKKITKTLRWQVLLATGLIIVIVPVVIAAALATDANARVQDSRNNLLRILNTFSTRPLDQLKTTDIERITFGIESFIQDMARARSQIGFLNLFAGASSDLKAQLSMLDIAQDIALGAQEMLTGARPSLFLLLGKDETDTTSLNLSSADRLVELLKIGQGSFVNANKHLTEAKVQLDALNLEKVSLTSSRA